MMADRPEDPNIRTPHQWIRAPLVIVVLFRPIVPGTIPTTMSNLLGWLTVVPLMMAVIKILVVEMTVVNTFNEGLEGELDPAACTRLVSFVQSKQLE